MDYQKQIVSNDAKNWIFYKSIDPTNIIIYFLDTPPHIHLQGYYGFCSMTYSDYLIHMFDFLSKLQQNLKYFEDGKFNRIYELNTEYILILTRFIETLWKG